MGLLKTAATVAVASSVHGRIQRRQQAYYVLAKMRARHDRNAANRMLKVVDGLNARIARDNQLISKGAYAAPVGWSPISERSVWNGVQPELR